jgi:acetyltransferase-like isoleucine patch superfamily enzyme
MLTKVRAFCKEPSFNKLNHLQILCAKLKGALVYRFFFKRFGKGSYIRRPMLILNPQFITISDRVSVAAGVRLEAICDNPKRIPDLQIGENTNIEQNVHIVCHSRIHIGRNVSITGNCAIVDVTHPFDDVQHVVKIGAAIRDDDSWVEIGEGSFIGFGTVILPNVRIGKYVVVGANSVVNGDLPEYSVAAGAPARVISTVCQGPGKQTTVAE